MPWTTTSTWRAFPTYLAEWRCASKQAIRGALCWPPWARKWGMRRVRTSGHRNAELWMDFAEGMGRERDLRGRC